jgi:hypothetical protein
MSPRPGTRRPSWQLAKVGPASAGECDRTRRPTGRGRLGHKRPRVRSGFGGVALCTGALATVTAPPGLLDPQKCALGPVPTASLRGLGREGPSSWENPGARAGRYKWQGQDPATVPLWPRRPKAQCIVNVTEAA